MLPEVAVSSILLIVIVLFPGLIFRRFYYWSKFTKQFVKGEWSERIVTSIFWGIISQLITLLLISYILPILQIKLLEKDIIENDIIEKIRDFSFADMDIEEDRILLFFILGYILFSIIVAGLLGFILHKFVRLFGIDIRIEAFRYSNQWHYIFQGEVPKSKKQVLFPWVDVTLVTQQEDGKQKMIQGVLKDYQINATTGDLEYLYLEKAERYSHTQKDFKKILSDIFVIPSQNIVDLNIRYKYKNEENNIEKAEEEKNVETEQEEKNIETNKEEEKNVGAIQIQEEKNIEKVEEEKNVEAIQEEKNLETNEEEEKNVEAIQEEKNLETNEEEEKNVEAIQEEKNLETNEEEEKNVEVIQEEKDIETNEEEEKNVEVIQEEKDIEKIVEREKERRAKQRKELFLARFMLFMIIVYILFPWIIAKEGVIWWKKILSYFPLFICFINITGGFVYIVSGKSKNWIFTIMISFIFSYLGWWVASLLLS